MFSGKEDLKQSIKENYQMEAVQTLQIQRGNGEKFINKVASMSRTSHVNIVSLLGFYY
ncbi:unnamed protein product [Brassica oleracea var. botrytis]|uniref:(rape) hypothetical protein n=1 Tax=Brassica napus TaxID=3708 RepID=A0A816J568_BRANA|nr:unnamed protein product [Brassica napus]